MVKSRILAVLMAAIAPVMASAALEICNDTEVRQTVAIGYKSGDDWVSEGWWNIDPFDCVQPVKGDLERRYYYYLSRARDWEFDDENYHFCTTPDVFTIEGDENCADRGYDTGRFRRIDTGETAQDFSVTLSPFTRAASGAAAADQGEPYAGAVVFQECVPPEDGGAAYCSFHGQGTKFFVYDDGRTPGHVLSLMQSMLPGTPMDVQGALTGIYDRTAEVVLSTALPRAWGEADTLLDRLQGHWYAVNDANAQFTVLGAERINTYDGAPGGTEYLSVQDQCGEFAGAGPYLYARDEETGEDLCYVIDYVDQLQMTLIYLPRGNLLEYRKLD